MLDIMVICRFKKGLLNEILLPLIDLNKIFYVVSLTGTMIYLIATTII